MDREGDHAWAIGAEAARRAVVVRPLVLENLSGTGSLESGLHVAVWELGVSRATVWRWIWRLAEDVGRPVRWCRRSAARAGATVISSEVEALIEECLHRYYFRRERASLSRVVGSRVVNSGYKRRHGEQFSDVLMRWMSVKS